MALSPEEIQKISKKFGKNVATREGVRLFKDEVKRQTGVELARNTLRRLFGLDTNPVKPRRTTLNIIARTLGYTDWGRFVKNKQTLKEGFFPDMTLTYDMASLDKAVFVRISWNPDRSLLLEHLGDGKYNVIVSENGKLRKDDILMLKKLTLGLPFEAIDVVRDQKSIGGYISAYGTGIEKIIICSV